MASGVSVSSKELAPMGRITSRRRPLHTCGASFLAVLHKAYTKALDFNGPIGSITKRISTSVSPAFPFLHAMQYQWLAILSFADDQILAVEYIIENLFPPSTVLFNTIDKLVQVAEALPGKFDVVMHKFPVIIHQIPFLDWAVVHLISWLNFLITTLTHLGSSRTKEREIVVDINCHNLNNKSETHCPLQSMKSTNMLYSLQDESEKVEDRVPVNVEPSISEPLEDESKMVDESKCSIESHLSAEQENVEASSPNLGTMKCSYKEILEKGTKKNIEKEEGRAIEGSPKSIISEEEVGEEGEKGASKSNEAIIPEDPILELFEASWHMNPGKVGKVTPLLGSFPQK